MAHTTHSVQSCSICCVENHSENVDCARFVCRVCPVFRHTLTVRSESSSVFRTEHSVGCQFANGRCSTVADDRWTLMIYLKKNLFCYQCKDDVKTPKTNLFASRIFMQTTPRWPNGVVTYQFAQELLDGLSARLNTHTHPLFSSNQPKNWTKRINVRTTFSEPWDSFNAPPVSHSSRERAKVILLNSSTAE
jgi:hypothetical protein